MKRGREELDAAAAPTNKKTAETNGSSHGIASLPASALSLVWSYAVSMKISDDVCENGEHQLFQMNTHELQLVCRAWRETMQEITREKLRGVAIVDVVEATKAHGDSTEPLVLTIQSFDKTSPVTDVRIAMGDIISGEDVNDRGIWSDTEQPLIAVRVQRDFAFHKTQPDIDWEATLKPHGDTITRLDLSRMLLYTKTLGNLLQAAATLCPNVKALIMPPTEKKMYKKEDVRRSNMDALHGAMQAWHKSNGGLTHLRVPYLGMNDLVTSLAFITMVAKFCPDIEHLDGWRFTFIEQANLEFITCDEFWFSPPELLSTLLQNCKKLKSFNTVVLPAGEDLYAEFADAEKPHLEELVLSANSLLANPSGEFDSDLYQSITESVPALRSLTITCGDTDEEIWKASEVFDDGFFLALAKNCPKLEKLEIKSFADLEKCTVASLSALLEMPAVSKIGIRSIVDLDEGFLDVLTTRIRKKKDLRMRLTVMRMRDMIWKVLSLIAGMKTEELNGVSLSLSLKTHEAFGFVLANGDDQNARCHESAEVHKLFNEIKRVHGSMVRVHVHTTLPANDHDSKCVLFDSLELSINDPQGFCCTRDKFVECGIDDIEQELCGEAVRADGVFERDPKGALEDLEMAMYHSRRPRKVFYPDLLSDDDEDGEFGDDMGGEFDDDGDAFVFAEGDDDGDFDEEDGEDDDEEDVEEHDEGDEDADDIFGNGEEDDEEN